MNVIYGVAAGAVNVLPSTSLMSYCNSNVTLLYPTSVTMYQKFVALDFKNGLLYFKKLTKYMSNSLFNCYYSVKDPTTSSGYKKTFSFMTVMWNILFNLGFMYTDIYKLTNNLLGSTAAWYNVGFYCGDFVIRFLYSNYVERDYYPF